MPAYAEDWDKKAKLENSPFLGTFELVSASIDKPFINIRSGTMTTTIDKAKVAT